MTNRTIETVVESRHLGVQRRFGSGRRLLDPEAFLNCGLPAYHNYHSRSYVVAYVRARIGALATTATMNHRPSGRHVRRGICISLDPIPVKDSKQVRRRIRLSH